MDEQRRYFGNWSGFQEMARDFQNIPEDITDQNILFAAYDTPDYEGQGRVIFEKDGRLPPAFKPFIRRNTGTTVAK